MKANQSSKNFKNATRILTVAICIGLAFSLIAVEQSEAILGIALVIAGVFIAGVIIGWLANDGHDVTTPDALVTSEENYVLVWNDFFEDWNNDYIDENVDLANYMMMYNLTFLDSVRRAEHDVSSYVHFINWSEVEDSMTSLTAYKENITKFIVSSLHGYNRIDVSVLQHIYDTDVWSYTTPMKHGKAQNPDSNDWSRLTFYGDKYMFIPQYNQMMHIGYQYKVPFGTYPVGYSGDYDIGDKFFVTYIYVPTGNFITLKNLDTDVSNTYYGGVHNLQGEATEVISVTARDSTVPSFDNTGVYLFGVPTDFNILSDNFIIYNTGLGDVDAGSSQTLTFEKSKHIESIYISATGTGTTYVWINDELFTTLSQANSWVNINDYVYEITIENNIDTFCLKQIKTEGYIYHDMTGRLRVDTDLAGTAYITDNLPARGRIGLDWMVDSYKTIYEGMIINAKILWNLYHANGWYSTDDIPSEFLVVPPDVIFDNMDALKNLPLDDARAIYYTWMGQLIDFYDENPDYVGTFDDTDMTMFDNGIVINASLIHGGNTVFDNHQIYISPLLGDFVICKDNLYILTQKIFIYDITDTYIYYGYIGDNLTIHNISIDGVETECVTLGRQTMQDFLVGKYGFSISFTGEWQFPEIVSAKTYLTIGIGCIVSGILIAVASSGKYKKYRVIGYLLILIGSGVIVFTYIIPAIQSFFESLIFW